MDPQNESQEERAWAVQWARRILGIAPEEEPAPDPTLAVTGVPEATAHAVGVLTVEAAAQIAVTAPEPPEPGPEPA